MVPASGIKLPFALSPEDPGKGSVPAAGTDPPLLLKTPAGWLSLGPPQSSAH